MEACMVPIDNDEAFPFRCTPNVPCFNACCGDLTQFLTPYDIVRLKNRLGLSSRDFLKQYTVGYDGPRSGLPVVSLKPKDGPGKKCPFVTPAGCAVYEDRPSSCRIYPLARAVTRSRSTGRLTEHYALLKEPHCRGHRGTRQWTAAAWIADQGLAAYHEVNDRFLSVIGAKNRWGSGPLDLKSRRMFHLALYDMDAWRMQLQKPGFLDSGMTPPDDESALLKFGHDWVCRVLFTSTP